MKKCNILELVLCVGITILIVVLICKKDKKPDTLISYEYRTDTIWSDTVFILQEPLKIVTPPKTVTIYKTDTSSLDSLTILVKEKDIITPFNEKLWEANN